jgi:hypothetical protein
MAPTRRQVTARSAAYGGDRNVRSGPQVHSAARPGQSAQSS